MELRCKLAKQRRGESFDDAFEDLALGTSRRSISVLPTSRDFNSSVLAHTDMHPVFHFDSDRYPGALLSDSTRLLELVAELIYPSPSEPKGGSQLANGKSDGSSLGSWMLPA